MAEFLFVGNRDKKTAGGLSCYASDLSGRPVKHLRTQFADIFIGAVVIDAERRVLYCTDERSDLPGLHAGGGGRVLAFSIDPDDGTLTPLCESPSFGAKPSFIEFDAEQRFMLVTNHGGRTVTTFTERDAFGNFNIQTSLDEASVVLFPLRGDGSWGSPCDIFRLEGSGPKSFQLGAHAHVVHRAPAQNLYAVCDKGGDQVWLLRIDYERRRLVPALSSPFRCDSGSAPRYCAFHPREPWLFVNKESAAKISAFRYGKDSLERIAEIDTLPAGAPTPPNEALLNSDIRLNADGTVLYDLARVLNTISVYRVAEDGRPIPLQTVTTASGGRIAAFAPDGKKLAVAFPDEHKVDLFELNEDGTLGTVVATTEEQAPATLNYVQF